jgi:hypothetical protein
VKDNARYSSRSTASAVYPSGATRASGSSGFPDASGLRLRLLIAALTFLAAACIPLAWTLNNWDRPTTAVVWGGFALTAEVLGLLCLVGGALFHDLGLRR